MAERLHPVEGGPGHLGIAQDSVHRWIERSRTAAWNLKLSQVDDWGCANGCGRSRKRAMEPRRAPRQARPTARLTT